MALCERSNRRIRGKRLCKIVIFVSADTSGSDGTNNKALKSFTAMQQWLRGQKKTPNEELKKTTVSEKTPK